MAPYSEPAWRLPSLTTDIDRNRMGNQFRNLQDYYDHDHLKILPACCDPIVLQEVEKKRKQRLENMSIEAREVELRSGKRVKRKELS